MRRAAAVLVLVGLATVPLAAQGRGRDRAQGIPPGHLPPPGSCRVWYDGRPPGQQPRPTSCREAERIAARDRYARVIYGTRGTGPNDGWWNDGDWRTDDRGRAIPRRYPRGYPGGYPYPDSGYSRGGYGYANIAFNTGYEDGYDKGREDARDRDAYDPVRHGRYRSADHGYNRRYGSKDEYRVVYREGFRAGYDDAYRRDYGGGYRQRDGIRLPWPF